MGILLYFGHFYTWNNSETNYSTTTNSSTPLHLLKGYLLKLFLNSFAEHPHYIGCDSELRQPWCGGGDFRSRHPRQIPHKNLIDIVQNGIILTWTVINTYIIHHKIETNFQMFLFQSFVIIFRVARVEIFAPGQIAPFAV